MTRRDRALDVDRATSERLGRVRQRDTAPELLVRRLATDVGLKYRVRNRDLPGSPDLANRSRKWVVFVHGCFWHSHRGCGRATVPKRNREFWETKFSANRTRDARVIAELKAEGFAVLVVWECELDEPREIKRRLTRLAQRI